MYGRGGQGGVYNGEGKGVRVLGETLMKHGGTVQWFGNVRM